MTMELLQQKFIPLLSIIHYKTETGEYDDIDLTIVPERNWEFEYALKKNTLRAYFNDATDIENFTLVGIELINNQGVARWITFKMLDATPTDSSYEGNRFKYHNVFLNVDLEYTVTPEKLKENIIVHDPSALQPFTFSLKLDDGLEMQLQPNNEIHFIDKETGEKLWKIQAPFAVDSSEEQRRTDNVIYTFGKAVYQGVEYDTITIEIQDDEFLENAVYPIEIDPTVVLDYASGIVVDTYVDAYNSGSNFGGQTEMWLGSIYNAVQRFTPMFKIDIQSIPFNAIIESSILTMTQTYTSDYQRSMLIKAYQYNESRISNTSTYNTTLDVEQGIFYSNDTGSTAGTTGQYPISVSIKNLLQNCVNAGKTYAGFYLELAILDGYYVKIASTENTSVGIRPKLNVTYKLPPTAPTITAPNSGETWNAQHTITWNPATDQEVIGHGYASGTIQADTYNTKQGQTFTPTNDLLTQVDIYCWSAGSSSIFDVELWSVNTTTNRPETLISVLRSGQVVNGSPQWVSISGLNISLTPGQRYAIVVKYVSGSSVNIGYKGDNVLSGYRVYYQAGSWQYTYNNGDLTIKVYVNKSNLQYHIQLSTNNGSSWSDIVSLTSPGVTSYNYDFSGVPETTQAKIRIRAYNGTSYGPWAESGVFSIVHKTQIGTFKIQTPTGILTLPIYDPNVGMTGKNQLRIQIPRGIGCFELVPITDPNASPLRVYTPSGVKAIAKQ